VIAPARLAAWLAKHEHRDPRFGHVYRYHPRSDVHSVALCDFIMEDLLAACPVLRQQAERGEIAYGVNVVHLWRRSQERKTIDLAIGRPPRMELPHPHSGRRIVRQAEIAEVLVSCEAKTVMTEHQKSQPRVYDELNSSHRIVHEGRRDAIAAGITVVNIATTFVSPLRNQRPDLPLHVTVHKQPQAADNMVKHLRGLPIRDSVDEEGFDAYCTVVVDCDNQSGCDLWSAVPAPQVGDRDHYQTFVERIARFYTQRFSTLT
jgi:hypothetical protein